MLCETCHSHAYEPWHGCQLESSRCDWVSVRLLALAGSAMTQNTQGSPRASHCSTSSAHVLWSEHGTLLDMISFVIVHVLLPGPNTDAFHS